MDRPGGICLVDIGDKTTTDKESVGMILARVVQGRQDFQTAVEEDRSQTIHVTFNLK